MFFVGPKGKQRPQPKASVKHSGLSATNLYLIPYNVNRKLYTYCIRIRTRGGIYEYTRSSLRLQPQELLQEKGYI